MKGDEMPGIIWLRGHPLYREYEDKRIRKMILEHKEFRKINPDKTFVPKVFNAQILSIELFLKFTELKKIQPISYQRLADPWEKATRMICGKGCVDEFL